ncbi:hypothetical protein QUV80_11275 [Paraclostridium benzoelyticum]|nr:hypothetical protein [Paraclostridium benzoelyticum]
MVLRDIFLGLFLWACVLEELIVSIAGIVISSKRLKKLIVRLSK